MLRTLYTQAIVMGMGYDEYWIDDPKLFKCYIDAYKQTSENKELVSDRDAWLNGMYVARAIGASFNKNSKYPQEPLYAGEKMKEVSTVKKDDEGKAIEKAYKEMLLFSSNFNANRKGA